MLETLVTIHSWVRWLVLLGLITGAVFGDSRRDPLGSLVEAAQPRLATDEPGADRRLAD